MSHVDEGALHAYLDGALDEYPQAEAERIRGHLDACAECAERLEEERRIRSDAHAMLDLAAPAVEAPGLEELRAYVERTRPRKSRISRMQRLGWAASVVLALGAGWMIREGQLQTRALDVRQERVLAPAVDEIPGESPEAAEPAPGVVSEEAEARELSVQAARPAVEADAAAKGETPDDDPAIEQPSLADVVVVGDSSQAAETLVIAADDAPEQAVVSLDADIIGGDSAVGATGAGATYVGATPPVGDTAAAEAEEVEIAPTTQELERDVTVTAAVPSVEDRRRAIDSPSVSESALRTGLGEPSLAPTTPVEGLASEDSMAVEPLLAIPGYEVISVTSLGDGTTAWGVRVLQALGDGRRLEVVNLEPGIDPVILPDLTEGWNEVRARTGPRWIVLRGPLTEAELSALLERLFPESR